MAFCHSLCVDYGKIDVDKPGFAKAGRRVCGRCIQNKANTKQWHWDRNEGIEFGPSELKQVPHWFQPVTLN